MAVNASVAEFQRRLLRIPPRVRAHAFTALGTYADKMQAAMQSAVPRDEGKLAASIRQTESLPDLRITIAAGGPTTTRPVREGASATYDYALAQEFGTSKMPANPFFWPAYRLFKKPMRSAVKRAMKKGMKEVFPTEDGP